MRVFCGLAAALFTLAGPGQAATTPVLNGTFEVFATKGQCLSGEAVGTIGTVRFQQLASGTGLSFVLPSDVRSFFLPKGVFTKEFKTVKSMYMRFSFAPLPQPVSIKFTSQAPAVISAQTAEVRVIGEIKGYTSTNCISVFRATLVRWLQS